MRSEVERPLPAPRAPGESREVSGHRCRGSRPLAATATCCNMIQITVVSRAELETVAGLASRLTERLTGDRSGFRTH